MGSQRVQIIQLMNGSWDQNLLLIPISEFCLLYAWSPFNYLCLQETECFSFGCFSSLHPPASNHTLTLLQRIVFCFFSFEIVGLHIGGLSSQSLHFALFLFYREICLCLNICVQLIPFVIYPFVFFSFSVLTILKLCMQNTHADIHSSLIP